MKIFHAIMFLITIGFLPLSSAFAQDFAVQGRIIATANREPIGAFTVKAYHPTSVSGTGTPASIPSKPIAQTLTRADGSYSLSISTTLKTVILRFEKLSYFSVPPQQTVQLTSPNTTVPDVAAMRYTYGQTVSTQDLLDAFAIRQTSINAMNTNLSPVEREKARKASFEYDLNSLKKSGVDSTMIMEVKRRFVAP